MRPASESRRLWFARFQSTHSKKCDHHLLSVLYANCRFNPHTPKGATIIENFLRLNYISFNPRTPKSVTFSISSFLISFVISIHASTKARDTLRVQIPPSAPNFNPRATHEVWPNHQYNSNIIWQFNSSQDVPRNTTGLTEFVIDVIVPRYPVLCSGFIHPLLFFLLRLPVVQQSKSLFF